MSKRELPMREKLKCCGARLFGLLAYDLPMKQIKLSGRELAVLRSIDYASGSTGNEIRERTMIDGSDLADILNGLCEVGYVEIYPPAEPVTYLNYAESRFEINPSYALQLKESMRRS
jgi:hypothetical protein